VAPSSWHGSLGDFDDIHISVANRDNHLGGIKLFSMDGAHLKNVTITGITMDM